MVVNTATCGTSRVELDDGDVVGPCLGVVADAGVALHGCAADQHKAWAGILIHMIVDDAHIVVIDHKPAHTLKASTRST